MQPRDASIQVLASVRSSGVPGIDASTAAGSVVGPLSAMLLKLYVLRQAMLSRSSTDCLEMLCSARNSHLGPAALGDILQQVLQQESAWLQKDADLMLALTKLIETGFIRSVCNRTKSEYVHLSSACVPFLAHTQQRLIREPSSLCHNLSMQTGSLTKAA